MTATVVTTEVDRSAEDVFGYATDPSRFREWQRGVVSARLDTDGPPAVGDVCVTTRRIGGADRETSARLVRFDPPHTWAIRGLDGPIRADVDVTVEPLSETRSRLTVVVAFTGHGIGRVLVPLVVRPQASKEMPANLAALKARLEAWREPPAYP